MTKPLPHYGMIQEKLVVLPSEIERQQKRQKRFVKLPYLWIDRLAVAKRMATYRVAHHILRKNFERSGQSFPLPNGIVPGVDRSAKHDALRELERLGLIRVERRPNKSPVIRVLS